MKRYGDHRHRSRATEFKKGVSGNPKGRPPGTGWRQRAALLCDSYGLDLRNPEHRGEIGAIYDFCWLLCGVRRDGR